MSTPTSLICIDTSPTKTAKMKGKGKATAATGAAAPPWHGKRGTKRVVLEYRHLEAEIRAAAGAGGTAGGASGGAVHVPPVR
jgi:hypothetical protein